MTGERLWVTSGAAAMYPEGWRGPCLGVSAGVPQIVDWPATYHAGGCGFGFCDGHAEIHKWRSGRMALNGPASTVAATGDLVPDWTWLWTHATVRMK